MKIEKLCFIVLGINRLYWNQKKNKYQYNGYVLWVLEVDCTLQPPTQEPERGYERSAELPLWGCLYGFLQVDMSWLCDCMTEDYLSHWTAIRQSQTWVCCQPQALGFLIAGALTVGLSSPYLNAEDSLGFWLSPCFIYSLKSLKAHSIVQKEGISSPWVFWGDISFKPEFPKSPPISNAAFQSSLQHSQEFFWP